MQWVDGAKGLCIVAVVTLYSTGIIEEALHARGWVHDVVTFAQPFRMPDFFLISGLFVGRVLWKPWRRYFDRKVLHYFYFYVVWLTVRLLLGQLGDEPATTLRAWAGEYAWSFLQPPGGPLWFIYLLPFLFVALRVTRWVPGWVMVPAAVALHLWAPVSGWSLPDRFAQYFVFVYAGFFFAPRIFAAVAWTQAHPRVAVLLLCAWAGTEALATNSGVPLGHVPHLVLALLGAMAVILTSALLERWGRVQWFSALGSRSLVVYLAFGLPLVVLRRAVVALGLSAQVGFATAGCIALSIAGALALHRLVRHTPLRLLFERPRWVSLESRQAVLLPQTDRAAPSV